MTDTQALWPQMISALAAIDDALGLPQDGCNSTAKTLARIKTLRSQEKQLTELREIGKLAFRALASASKVAESVDADNWTEDEMLSDLRQQIHDVSMSLFTVLRLPKSEAVRVFFEGKNHESNT